MELPPFSHVLLFLRGVVLCLQLQRVVLGCLDLDFSFALQFGAPFPCFRIHRSKVSLLLFKLLLNFDSVSVSRAERGDVQELHLILYVFE